MNSVVSGVLHRLGFDPDGPSNSGADFNQETNRAPANLNVDEDHRDDRPTTLKMSLDDAWTEFDKQTKQTEPLSDGMVYLTLDGDDVGKEVEDSLMSNETDTATILSAKIRATHELILAAVEAAGGHVIFDGGDNAMAVVPDDAELIETIKGLYLDNTGHTVTVGIGAQPIEAHKALVYGKNTGKNVVVHYDARVEEESAKIKQKQKELEKEYEALKYRAANQNGSSSVEGRSPMSKPISPRAWSNTDNPRWTYDPGSIPGEPLEMMDLPEDGGYEDSRAVIVENDNPIGQSTYSVVDAQTWKMVAEFDTIEEAREFAEKQFPEQKVTVTTRQKFDGWLRHAAAPAPEFGQEAPQKEHTPEQEEVIKQLQERGWEFVSNYQDFNVEVRHNNLTLGIEKDCVLGRDDTKAMAAEFLKKNDDLTTRIQNDFESEDPEIGYRAGDYDNWSTWREDWVRKNLKQEPGIGGNTYNMDDAYFWGDVFEFTAYDGGVIIMWHGGGDVRGNYDLPMVYDGDFEEFFAMQSHENDEGEDMLGADLVANIRAAFMGAGEFTQPSAPEDPNQMKLPFSESWLKKPSMKRKAELDEDQLKKELAESMQVDVEDIELGDSDNDGGTFTVGSEEWRYFWDEDMAEQTAKDQVKNDLESEPEIFNQEWLQSHISISDTDKRMIASEEADDQVDNVMDDQQILEKAGVTDEYDEADDDAKETILEEAKETARDAISDEIESELDDPIQYFVNDRGIYSVEDLMKASFISIDIESATDEAVSTDGWPHFISHYDGNYETTSSGVVYFREN